jgi:hypothetical protein
VLRLCGYGISGDDADYLITTLTNRGTPAAIEAAAAIRLAITLHDDTPELGPELRAEILSALEPLGVGAVRNTLLDVQL